MVFRLLTTCISVRERISGHKANGNLRDQGEAWGNESSRAHRTRTM